MKSNGVMLDGSIIRGGGGKPRAKRAPHSERAAWGTVALCAEPCFGNLKWTAQGRQSAPPARKERRGGCLLGPASCQGVDRQASRRARIAARYSAASVETRILHAASVLKVRGARSMSLCGRNRFLANVTALRSLDPKRKSSGNAPQMRHGVSLCMRVSGTPLYSIRSNVLQPIRA